VSDDRLIRILEYLVVLLFVTAGVLPLARGSHSWVRWARWGSIVIFAVAFLYAAVLVLRWGAGWSD
jgi:hypothetical protein